MRPPSSPSEAFTDPGQPEPSLLGPLFGAPDIDEALSDSAFLQAMLDVEAAIAKAGADTGLLSPEVANMIAAVCRADDFDVGELGRRGLDAGNPVVPLVRDIASRVPTEAAAFVHLGATSQDVLDTALSLLAFRGLGRILDSLAGLADEAARLSAEHRDTLMMGRTLLQQALPTSFGRKAAGWLTAVDDARARLVEIREQRLAVQLGGAVGTLASLGPDGPRVVRHLARHLGLAEPLLPWHTDRTRLAELAVALGVTAGTLGKIALDITLLAQSEVAEVSEGGSLARGGSSTLPHKRNPVTAVLVAAGTRRVPQLVATVLAAMAQEHERAAGAWHAEWEPLRELLRLVGGAAAHSEDLLANLRVDPLRMRDNLVRAGDVVMAESVAARLAPALGRTGAGDHVRRLVQQATGSGTTLRAALLTDPVVRQQLDEDAVDAALDPSAYLGSAGVFVDRALAAHRDGGSRTIGAFRPDVEER